MPSYTFVPLNIFRTYLLRFVAYFYVTYLHKKQERHRQLLGKVPCNVELTVPNEVLAHRNRQLHVNIDFTAGLLLVVVTRNVGIESNRVREPTEIPFTDKLQVLRLALDELERSERLQIWRILILETAAIVARVLIRICGVVETLFVR